MSWASLFGPSKRKFNQDLDNPKLMKCSNWILKTHQQTFQSHITFQLMMNTMFIAHKVIKDNELWFHGKKYAKEKMVFFHF